MPCTKYCHQTTASGKCICRNTAFGSQEGEAGEEVLSEPNSSQELDRDTPREDSVFGTIVVRPANPIVVISSGSEGVSIATANQGQDLEPSPSIDGDGLYSLQFPLPLPKQ